MNKTQDLRRSARVEMRYGIKTNALNNFNWDELFSSNDGGWWDILKTNLTGIRFMNEPLFVGWFESRMKIES